MAETDRVDCICRIIAKYYAEWANAPMPVHPLCLGKAFSERVAIANKTRKRGVAAFRAFLKALEDGELEAILGNAPDIDPAPLRLRLAEIRRSHMEGLLDASRLLLTALGAYPNDLADYGHWAMRDRYSKRELLWLSVGLEPSDKLDAALDDPRKGKENLDKDGGREILCRHDLLARANLHGFHDVVDAAPACDWMHSVDLDCPAPFRAMLKTAKTRTLRLSGELPSPPPESGSPDKREIRTVAKILTAIAIREYGYRPEQQRSPIPREIAGICAELGLEVSDETVLKYLRIGASQLPKDED